MDKINFHEREHDIEGRNMLGAICKGKVLDLGSADRPITSTAIRVDHNPECNPDIIADVKNIPVDDNSIDTIIASHILEHNDNIIDTLKEWLRILKPNGEIGIMVPHGEYVDCVDLGDTSMTHRTLFTEKTLKIYLKHVGFKDVSSERIERPLSSNKTPAIIAFAKK